MKVKDVMTAGIETISPDATLEQAARKMYAHNVGVLPVVDGRTILGVVTDRDITVRGLARGCSPSWTSVREVMSLDPWTCEEDEDVAQASRRMEQNMVRRLLVLDHNGYLVGMVSVTDVAVKGHNERVAGRVLGRVSAVG